MLKLTTLVWLQFLYAFLGISYNLISLALVQVGSVALSPTSPRAGVLALAVYSISLFSYRISSVVPYRVLMGLSVLVFGYGGVALHASNFSELELYFSELSWATAIGINAFGLILNVCATFGQFRRNV